MFIWESAHDATLNWSFEYFILHSCIGNLSSAGATSNMDTNTSRSSRCNVETRRLSQLVLDIITEHSLNKFDDSSERLAAGLDSFLHTIEAFVVQDATIQTCLPAFPFKSANKEHKVLGSLPDKAEELALERLNHMCTRVQEVYAPGARVTIVSDGITYNGNKEYN